MSARRGGGGKSRPLDNPKKKGLKIIYKKILTCKRLPSYVMQGTFTTKGPHVMRYIFT